MNNTAFGDTQLDRLDGLCDELRDAGFEPLSLDEIQGFLCATVSGPDAFDLEEYWSALLGETPRDHADAAELATLLVQYKDHILAQLAEGEGLTLIVYGEDGQEDYKSWCGAYLYGLDSVKTDWFEATGESEEFEELFVPLFVLANEGEELEKMMPPSEAERRACRENLVPSLIAIYQYWQVIKCKPAQRIVGKKIGSNEACPCGSGKKFKKCCGE